MTSGTQPAPLPTPADQTEAIFQQITTAAAHDDRFRERLARAVQEAEHIANPRAAGADATFVTWLIEQFTSEHRFAVERVQSGLGTDLEHSHKALLLVGAIMGIVMPAVAVSKLLQPAWMWWVIVWFSVSLCAGIVRMYATIYLTGSFLNRRQAYLRALMGLLGQSFDDARALNQIPHQDQQFETWQETWRMFALVVLASDVLFVASFVSAIGCFCAGLTT